ncbi:hypothetical protein [Trichodesmium erythraeum]|nr:hypothetical protein [Trichodesmium sp. St11_bin5]MDT9338975.1 hypothetical protein [Trichodesmium erythraeum 21-75]
MKRGQRNNGGAEGNVWDDELSRSKFRVRSLILPFLLLYCF